MALIKAFTSTGKVQAKPGSLVVTPLPMKFGTMVLCVVADRDHAATSYGTCFAELLQELQKGFAVENARFRAETETGHPANARPRSNPRSCVSDDDTRPGLCFPAESTCGSGNPAAESALRPAPTGPRCRPAISLRSFFYAPSAVPGRRAPTPAGACGGGSPSAGTSAGIDVRPVGPHRSLSIHADRVLPSHRLTRIPASPGLARSTRLISAICFSSQTSGTA